MTPDFFFLFRLIIYYMRMMMNTYVRMIAMLSNQLILVVSLFCITCH